MKQFLTASLIGLTLVTWAGAEEMPSPTDRKGLLIDVGTSVDTNFLDFGWSRAERGRGFRFRWVKHLEADIWLSLKEVKDLEMVFRAAPLYLNWQRQRIGLYVNNRFVAEWTCPDSPDYRDYTAVVDESFFKKGRNRITLRMGYRKKHSSDRRELSLAVSSIRIRSNE